MDKARTLVAAVVVPLVPLVRVETADQCSGVLRAEAVAAAQTVAQPEAPTLGQMAARAATVERLARAVMLAGQMVLMARTVAVERALTALGRAVMAAMAVPEQRRGPKRATVQRPGPVAVVVQVRRLQRAETRAAMVATVGCTAAVAAGTAMIRTAMARPAQAGQD